MRSISRVRRTDAYDSPPTPNIDDTPYIRYALEQLTREEEEQRPHTRQKNISHPDQRIAQDEGLGYMQSIKKVKPPAVVDIPPIWRDVQVPRSDRASVRSSAASTAKPEIYIPIPAPRNSPRYPDLTYKPMILRPLLMTILLLLCIFMITALMFCAIYSTKNHGFTTYSGGLYGGLYFVFGFLPQLLAAIIFLYFQSVVAGLTRIMPFVMMAGDCERSRTEAMFTRLYPAHWVPRFDLIRNGEAAIGATTVLIWPVLFSIPLQSALFSVIPRDGVFQWATVQGVAWTLIAIYIFAIVGLIMLMTILRRRTTGLIWDPTSLADVISLLPRSNNLQDFNDTEVLPNLKELRQALPPRADRLGFWRSTALSEGPELFHAIGEEGSATRRYTLNHGKTVPSMHKTSVDAIANHLSLPTSPIGGKAIPHHGTNSSLMAKVYSPAIRFRHVPRALTDTNLVFYPAAFFILYIIMLVFSFLPGTAITKGFQPLVSGNTNSAAFQPANFFFSFLPSLIGMIVYLCLLSLAQQICILTPWAEMNRTSSSASGATPQRSILLSYAHCISTPFATIIASFRNKHYLVTALSTVVPLSLLLPILGGGFLFPLLALPSQTLLIFPNVAAYYIILVILGVDFALLINIPVLMLRRSTRLSYRLPHGVNSLAEVISFLYSSQILEDATFRNVRGQRDLTTRLLTSSGTMASSEKRGSGLTGDKRFSTPDPSLTNPQDQIVAAPQPSHARRDGRGTWDPDKWGGVGGWVRHSDASKTATQHTSYTSAQSRLPRDDHEGPRYSTEAGDWSAWDKEMGISNLGGVITGRGRGISDVERHEGVVRRDTVMSDDVGVPMNRAQGTAQLSGKGLSTQPGGGARKRYFLGIFLGRDGRSHFGIERVGREEERGLRDGVGRQRGHGRNESRFSL